MNHPNRKRYNSATGQYDLPDTCSETRNPIIAYSRWMGEANARKLAAQTGGAAVHRVGFGWHVQTVVGRTESEADRIARGAL